MNRTIGAVVVVVIFVLIIRRRLVGRTKELLWWYSTAVMITITITLRIITDSRPRREIVRGFVSMRRVVWFQISILIAVVLIFLWIDTTVTMIPTTSTAAAVAANQ